MDIHMNLLCVIPPGVPSYFNAGHHLPVFMVAAFLRKQGHDVTVKDLGALNATWRDVCGLLVRNFDVIIVMNDFDSIDGFERFMEYVEELAPASKTITFGRGSRHVPGFFERFGFDAIAHAGDYECSVASYVKYLATDRAPSGVLLKEEGSSYRIYGPGSALDADDWVLPDVSEIPYDAYERLYQDDLNKFCGIPERRELVVPVARGCPIGCAFCDVPAQQGLRERRIKVDDLVDYIGVARSKIKFDYVSMYAPTFTLKKRWVLDFCDAIAIRHPDVKWKCVTTVSHLDAELISAMARAGCIRISVGVETTSELAAEALPKAKRVGVARLAEIEAACASNDIELNCFVMVGMGDESVAEATIGVASLMAQGHRIRPTVFTPYERMHPGMSVREFSAFNRQLLTHSDLPIADRLAAYGLLYANKHDRPTQVMNSIPVAR